MHHKMEIEFGTTPSFSRNHCIRRVDTAPRVEYDLRSPSHPMRETVRLSRPSMQTSQHPDVQGRPDPNVLEWLYAWEVSECRSPSHQLCFPLVLLRSLSELPLSPLELTLQCCVMSLLSHLCLPLVWFSQLRQALVSRRLH